MGHRTFTAACGIFATLVLSAINPDGAKTYLICMAGACGALAINYVQCRSWRS